MPTDTDTFTYTRAFSVPPARMWHLLTAAEFRAAWGAPEPGKTLVTLKADLTEGGVERQRCGPADAPEFESETRWYNLAEPDLCVYSEVIEAEGMRLGASLVTCRTLAKGTGSQVEITVAVSSFVGPEMIAEFRNGWDGSFAQLAALADQS